MNYEKNHLFEPGTEAIKHMKIRYTLPSFLLGLACSLMQHSHAGELLFKDKPAKNLNYAPVADTMKTGNAGNLHILSAGILLPVDEFSLTHVVGMGVSYSWSNRRFGYLKVLPKRIIGFTADAGLKYFMGRKEEVVAGNEFRYGNYLYLHAFGGMIYNPLKEGNLKLLAGPAMGIYMGHGEFGWGGQLEGSYYLNERISLSPALFLFKHKEANALFSAMLKFDYSF